MKIPFLKYSVISTKQHEDLKAAFDKQFLDISNATSFINSIEEGNLDVQYDDLDHKNPLFNALLSMREQMKSINEGEQERKWTTEGLASFVDILRNNEQSLEELCHNIISSLVKYIGANQGGLFILNDNNPLDMYLTLTACYAYDRKKYLDKKIDIGEGLIGQCFLEKESIFLTDVPENYMNITSGLGDATPGSIIIVPLITNEAIYGVIEIASFDKLKKHRVEFVEKLAESIASTISATRINEKTKHLLYLSQENEEKLRSQEEEMRQNLEELHATQEQMKRQEEEMIKNMEEMVEGMQQEMVSKEQEYLSQIEELKKQLIIKAN